MPQTLTLLTRMYMLWYNQVHIIDVYNIGKNESLYVYSDTFQEITT